MAVVSGTVHSVRTLDSYGYEPRRGQLVSILFTVAGTYAQADNGTINGLPTLIQNSRRNGKTVTLIDVLPGMAATKDSNGAVMALKTVAKSGNNATFEITDGDFTTELADATAVPAQRDPFELICLITEA